MFDISNQDAKNDSWVGWKLKNHLDFIFGQRKILLSFLKDMALVERNFLESLVGFKIDGIQGQARLQEASS